MHSLVSRGTSAGTTILVFVCSFVLVDFANELGIAIRFRAPSSFVLCSANVSARGLCHLSTLCFLPLLGPLLHQSSVNNAPT